MKYIYIFCRAGGTYRNIDKPNERKIHTNSLFHLGFVVKVSSEGSFQPITWQVLTTKPKQLTHIYI